MQTYIFVVQEGPCPLGDKIVYSEVITYSKLISLSKSTLAHYNPSLVSQHVLKILSFRNPQRGYWENKRSNEKVSPSRRVKCPWAPAALHQKERELEPWWGGGENGPPTTQLGSHQHLLSTGPVWKYISWHILTATMIVIFLLWSIETFSLSSLLIICRKRHSFLTRVSIC